MRTTPDGRPFTLRLLGQSSRAADTQNATLIREWLRAAGVALSPVIVNSSAQGDLLNAADYDLAFTSWSTNPDPDYVLALHTCAARPTRPGGPYAGDDFVCVPAYDALYTQQLAEYDQRKRSALVKQLQQQLYQDAYINVLYYPRVLEGYRNDRIATLQRQPDPGGMYANQDGYWGWWSAVPAAPARSHRGNRTSLLIAGAAVAAVVAAGAWLVIRRRGGADERA